MMARGAGAAAFTFVAVAIGAAVIWGQPPPETITGTAAIKMGAARASFPFSVTITQYASTAERDALLAAVRKEGTAGARRVLAAMKDAGVIQVGERRTTIKFASERPLLSGRLVTVLTAEPIAFVGGGLPNAKPRAGFDVALAILDLQGGSGAGELAPAAKIGVDSSGALRTEDYGATVIWLDGLSRAK